MSVLDDDTVAQPAVKARPVAPRRAQLPWYAVTTLDDWWKLVCVFLVGMGFEGVLTAVMIWWLR